MQFICHNTIPIKSHTPFINSTQEYFLNNSIDSEKTRQYNDIVYIIKPIPIFMLQ